MFYWKFSNVGDIVDVGKKGDNCEAKSSNSSSG